MKKEIKNTIAIHIARFIFAVLFVIFAAAILCGCKTQTAVIEKIDRVDSVRTEFVEVHDTIIQRDTLYLNEKTVKDAETETETTITFGEGGGTYDAKTGVATNVSGVSSKESKKEHELTERVEKLTSENKQLRHELDSTKKAFAIIHGETESQPVGMTKGERFMYTSGWILWSLIAAALIYFVIHILRKFKVIPV